MPRQSPTTRAEIRRKPKPPRGPFDELIRAPLARDLGSSRVGELKEEDYPKKAGMGDVQEQEGRRAKALKYATRMLKEGKGGKGPKKYT